MKLSDTRVVVRAAAALVLVAGCGDSSPTRPELPRPDCANPVFGAPAGSAYCLPYAAGSAYTVTQSYCAPPPGSHQGRFAYDFDLPMGTEVLAARAGEVVELREHWSDDDTRGGHENVVILRHGDNTLSLYIHMRHQGVLVEMGDYVPEGGLLGWSGSSGTGFPHIHFQVCLRGGECSTGTNEVTLPVNFRNAEGPVDTVGGLVAGATYRALACS
jgi:murein DD-endopeptidase MepM/ murein hydrolase activator NlpD